MSVEQVLLWGLNRVPLVGSFAGSKILDKARDEQSASSPVTGPDQRKYQFYGRLGHMRVHQQRKIGNDIAAVFIAAAAILTIASIPGLGWAAVGSLLGPMTIPHIAMDLGAWLLLRHVVVGGVRALLDPPRNG